MNYSSSCRAVAPVFALFANVEIDVCLPGVVRKRLCSRCFLRQRVGDHDDRAIILAPSPRCAPLPLFVRLHMLVAAFVYLALFPSQARSFAFAIRIVRSLLLSKRIVAIFWNVSPCVFSTLSSRTLSSCTRPGRLMKSVSSFKN